MEGTTPLQPPTKRQKVLKDPEGKKIPSQKILKERLEPFIWLPSHPRIRLLEMLANHHRDTTPQSNTPLNHNTTTTNTTNTVTTAPMKPPGLLGVCGIGNDDVETCSENVMERLDKIARKAR